ncbi:hypothetical protein [Lentzea kentuckyensis]|uniref:hypothetical protein n=1 Tax=Lentzea kentuckyensis TaxID=360086 RepID=UPI001B8011A6|nr:hypothetical protein [Lentzea kentuckyensis]
MPDDGASQRTFNRIYGDVAGNVVQAASVGSVHFYGRDAEPPPQQLLHDIAEFTGRDEHVHTLRSFVEEGLQAALFMVTDAGLAELARFAAAVSKPSFIRDDLLVKVQAVDHPGNAKCQCRKPDHFGGARQNLA